MAASQHMMYTQWIPDCFLLSLLPSATTYVCHSVKCHVMPFNLHPLSALPTAISFLPAQQYGLIILLEPINATFSFPRVFLRDDSKVFLPFNACLHLLWSSQGHFLHCKPDTRIKDCMPHVSTTEQTNSQA